MQTIAILDFSNNRVLTGTIPAYITQACEGTDIDEGQVVLDALGLSASECQYMVSDSDKIQLVMHTPLEQLTADFEADAMESINNQQ